MHTPLPGAGSFVPSGPERIHPCRIALLLLLLGTLFLSAPVQAPAQAFPGAPDERAVNLRVYPTDFWGPRAGFGVGLGLVGHNLARAHDQWLVTAAPARYEQVATLAFASANPRRARRSLLLDARALHTDRDWFGPASDRLAVERSSLWGRVRMGQTFLDGRVLFQPHFALTVHTVDQVQVPSPLPPAFSSVSGSIPSADTSLTGLRTGLDVRLATRPRPDPTRSGLRLQARWDRYAPVDGSDLRFHRLDLDLHGHLSLSGLHRLAVRTTATVTRSRTDRDIPLFLLPKLGGSRVPGWARGHFVDRDRLLGSLLYRFPLWTLGGTAPVEGHVGGHLGNVYRNVEDQFTPKIRFQEGRSVRGAPPLRPAASIGLRGTVPGRPHATVELALGVSPEGWSAVRFVFEHHLQALRPPHHSPDPRW